MHSSPAVRPGRSARRRERALPLTRSSVSGGEVQRRLLRRSTIGRTGENNLIVPQAMVSRQHARLDYRGGRFVLTDYSTNGTYIVPDRGATAMVHRDSVR